MDLGKIIGDLILEKLCGGEILNGGGLSSKKYGTGETCIIRSYGAGVFVGDIKEFDSKNRIVVLDNCIRLHKWGKAASLSQLALEGEKSPGETRYTLETAGHVVLQVIEIIPVTQKGKKSLYEVPKWKM
jgi:hypothetical protein